MWLPIFLLFGIGAAAGGFALFERGHDKDPHGLSVSETLKLHWKAMWHHQQAATASDPSTAAANLAAARDATTQMAPEVKRAATTSTTDLDRARAVALSDLMAAQSHLTAAMAELIQAKEAIAVSDPTTVRRYEHARRDVDAAIARVARATDQLRRLGVQVPSA